jgi:hypothetical protein
LCTPEILQRRLGARTPKAIGLADKVAAFDQMPLGLTSFLTGQKVNWRFLVREITEEPRT